MRTEGNSFKLGIILCYTSRNGWLLLTHTSNFLGSERAPAQWRNQGFSLVTCRGERALERWGERGQKDKGNERKQKGRKRTKGREGRGGRKSGRGKGREQSWSPRARQQSARGVGALSPRRNLPHATPKSHAHWAEPVHLLKKHGFKAGALPF